jgi:DNA-binding GntR family transcriptional regulator
MRAILLRRLRPGTKLGEDVIARMFNTNRMHVRKVFAHLAYRGIVSLQPNRGAFVARPTVREAFSVFEARRAIERACVQRLIEVLTPDAIAQLHAHNLTEQHADRTDRLAFISMSGEFHMLIARLCGNPLLLKFMEELNAQTSLIIAEYEHPASTDCSPDCHPRLVELIATRDRDGAVQLMDEHLQQMSARLHLHNQDEGVSAVNSRPRKIPKTLINTPFSADFP